MSIYLEFLLLGCLIFRHKILPLSRWLLLYVITHRHVKGGRQNGGAIPVLSIKRNFYLARKPLLSKQTGFVSEYTQGTHKEPTVYWDVLRVFFVRHGRHWKQKWIFEGVLSLRIIFSDLFCYCNLLSRFVSKYKL